MLNPVEARKVEKPEDRKWSSYRATPGLEKPPYFLTTDWILSRYCKNKKTVSMGYRKFVYDDIGKEGPGDKVTGGIFLGDSAFEQEVQNMMKGDELSRRIQLKKNRMKSSMD